MRKETCNLRHPVYFRHPVLTSYDTLLLVITMTLNTDLSHILLTSYDTLLLVMTMTLNTGIIHILLTHTRVSCASRIKDTYISDPRRCKTKYPRRCKTNLVGQSAGLSVPRSSVRFRQKLKNPRTEIRGYMDLRYIDPQARVLNYCFK